MSVFSNPKSTAAGAAAGYISALLELLGDQDPMAVLRETVPAARRTVDGLADAQIRRPEEAGKWSAVEVLQHLADSELVWAYRMRMVVCEERPPLTGYDQDVWAERLRYREADVADAVRQFERLRGRNLRLLETLSPADLRRVGLHSERGEESLAHMIRLYAGHDLVHLRQLERVVAAVTGARPS